MCFLPGTVMSVRLTTCMLSMLKTPCSLSILLTSPRTSAFPGRSVLYFFPFFSFPFLSFPKLVIIPVIFWQSESSDHTSNQIKSLLCTPIKNGKKDKVIGMIFLSSSLVFFILYIYMYVCMYTLFICTWQQQKCGKEILVLPIMGFHSWPGLTSKTTRSM